MSEYVLASSDDQARGERDGDSEALSLLWVKRHGEDSSECTVMMPSSGDRLQHARGVNALPRKDPMSFGQP